MTPETKPNPGKFTPLHLVSDAAEARRLIAAGADLEALDWQGETPLHHVASRARLDVVALLIRAGAKIDAVNFAGKTPLARLCNADGGVHETISVLLAAGADPRVAARDGSTALTVAEGRRDMPDLLARMRDIAAARDAVDAGAPPFHRLARLFPAMTAEEFKGLVADIETHGVREPVVMFEGLVVDGRHRYSAAVKLEILDRLPQEHWLGSEEDLIRRVVSVNLHRRHLSSTQRAFLAAELARLPRGVNRFTLDVDRLSAITEAEAAAMFGTSSAQIQRAKRVLASGSEALQAAAKAETLSLLRAAEIAGGMSKEEQDHVLALGAAIRAARRGGRVAQAIADIAATRHDPTWPNGVFDLLVVDPPWDYGNRGSGNQNPGYHYPLLSVAEIAALPLPLARNALVFVWVPSFFLADVLTTVFPRWGLAYAGSAVWVKPTNGSVVGNGFFRMRHEYIIVGRRGDGIPRGKQMASVIEATTPGRHSEKPAALMDWIDAAFDPAFRRLEVFCRAPREGWAAFGDDVALRAE